MHFCFYSNVASTSASCIFEARTSHWLQILTLWSSLCTNRAQDREGTTRIAGVLKRGLKHADVVRNRFDIEAECTVCLRAKLLLIKWSNRPSNRRLLLLLTSIPWGILYSCSEPQSLHKGSNCLRSPATVLALGGLRTVGVAVEERCGHG